MGSTRPVAHHPVMVSEVVDDLVTDPNGRFVDATVGEAGHARAILRVLGPDGCLLCLDWDPEAIAAAREALAAQGNRVRLICGNFGRLAELLPKEGWERIDGILVDLGLRSTALDDPERGFSYRLDGPLDMRFDRSRGVTAADLLARMRPETLVQVLECGTTRANPRTLSRAILNWRRERGLRTTGDLLRCLRASMGRRATNKLFASVFAALRMATNAEIEELERALATMPALLKTGGVLCVISYQSQEDARAKALGKAILRDPNSGEAFRMEPRYAKPLRPSPEEVRANPRARSARLRTFVRSPVLTRI